jgi:DNA-binding response OmpR family regulator
MDTERKKILVVDDEQDLREAIITALSYEGFEVIEAVDGENGLEVALREKPDLILLDVMMPKMDGIEMLARLRNDAWGNCVKVIIMTALDDMEKIAEAVEGRRD